MDADKQVLSFGQKAVGLSFNPSGDPNVNQIKTIFAEAIDALNFLRNGSKNGEVARMYSVAITEAQTAQMWGVKAATWKVDDAGTSLDAPTPTSPTQSPAPEKVEDGAATPGDEATK